MCLAGIFSLSIRNDMPEPPKSQKPSDARPSSFSFSYKPETRKAPRKPPSSVADYLSLSFAEPLVPPRVPKGHYRGNGIWGMMETAEERSAYGRYLASRRKPENINRRGRPAGTPDGWNHSAVQVARLAAEVEAEKLIKRLIKQGAIAADDAKGIAATKKALVMVRCPGRLRDRRRAAKRLLQHYHPNISGLL